MKAIGIQIDSNEVILVVLEIKEKGIKICPESTKLKLEDHQDSEQVKQFRDQVNATFDTIKPDKIGLRIRNSKAKGLRKPSPVSFKLEGIIQLYEKRRIDFVWPQTINAFIKKNKILIEPKNKYQKDALDVAYFLLS